MIPVVCFENFNGYIESLFGFKGFDDLWVFLVNLLYAGFSRVHVIC